MPYSDHHQPKGTEMPPTRNIQFAKDLSVGDTIEFRDEEVTIVDVQPYEADRSLYLRFQDSHATDRLGRNGHFCSNWNSFPVLA